MTKTEYANYTIFEKLEQLFNRLEEKEISEKMHIYADKILKTDGIQYHEIKENTKEGKAFLDAIKEDAVQELGYF